MARTKAKISLDLKGHGITISGTVLTYKIAEDAWEMLAEKDRRVLLHGFAQYVADAAAGMTLKSGFTPEERTAARVKKRRRSMREFSV